MNFHIKNLVDKLGANDRTHAVRSHCDAVFCKCDTGTNCRKL